MDGSDAGDGTRDQSGSRPQPRDDDAVTIDDGVVRWLRETDDWRGVVGRDIATCLAIIGVVSLLLFAISGTWPPLVAVESGSMEPAIERGDLILVVDEGRFAGDGAIAGTGVVTLERGHDRGHEQFGRAGDVIVFRPDGDPRRTPTIHRAHFWVEADERWVETKADREFVNGATCDDIASCPAPHDGFVTKGDANRGYDQVPRSGAETTVVSPNWVTGKAAVRVPLLGEIRLAVGSARAQAGVGPTVVAAVAGLIAVVLFAVAAAGRDP